MNTTYTGGEPARSGVVCDLVCGVQETVDQWACVWIASVVTQRSSLTTAASYAHTFGLYVNYTQPSCIWQYIFETVLRVLVWPLTSPSNIGCDSSRQTEWRNYFARFCKLLTQRNTLWVFFFGVLCLQIEYINLHFTCGAACRECNLYAHFNYFICAHKLAHMRHVFERAEAFNSLECVRRLVPDGFSLTTDTHLAHGWHLSARSAAQYSSRGETPPAALNCSHRLARRYTRTCMCESAFAWINLLVHNTSMHELCRDTRSHAHAHISLYRVSHMVGSSWEDRFLQVFWLCYDFVMCCIYICGHNSFRPIYTS